LDRTLPYDNLGQLRQKMIEANPRFGVLGNVEAAEWGAFGQPGPIDDDPFAAAVENFYMTDPISRASPTMAECTAVFASDRKEATGTDG
jgi:NADH-quinone oxidoreductase subunit G